jgi:hypothetical protein
MELFLYEASWRLYKKSKKNYKSEDFIRFLAHIHSTLILSDVEVNENEEVVSRSEESETNDNQHEEESEIIDHENNEESEKYKY